MSSYLKYCEELDFKMRNRKEFCLIFYLINCSVLGRFVNQNNSPDGKLSGAFQQMGARKKAQVKTDLFRLILCSHYFVA